MKLSLKDNITIPTFMSMLYIYNKGVTSARETRTRINILNDLYVYEVNRSLLEMDLVKLEKTGRTNKITLTEKGKKLADAITVMFDVLQVTEESFKDKPKGEQNVPDTNPSTI